MADPPVACTLPHHSHVCALLDSADDAAALLPLFIRDGCALGENVVAVAGGAGLAGLRGRLEALDATTRECEESGHLRLVPWTQVYAWPEAGLKTRTALASMEKFVCSAVGNGNAGARIVEHMDWVVSACGGGHAVTDYERGVDRLVMTYAQPVVCVYDLSRLSGQLLIEILTIHRLAMIRGALVASPFYRQPS
jgi:hypothetical protein